MKRLKIVSLVLLLSLAAACTRRSTETKTPAAEPIRVSAEKTDAAEPAIAAGPDGKIYVAWVEHRPNREADVMLAQLDSSGKVSSAPARVNPVAGKATAWRGDPPTLVVSRDGTIYIGWTARVDPDSAHATDIFLSSSTDGGRTFTSAKVNDDRQPAVHGMHSLAIAGDGRIYLAWLDERNISQPHPSAKAEGHHMESNREVFTTSSSDGGRTFLPNQKVAVDACPCCKTAIATAADHRVYLSWRQVLPGNFRHIAVASSSDEGKTFSQPQIVSDDRWVLAGCPVSGPAISASNDGSIRLIWYSEGAAGASGLYWSESRDGGRTFSPRNTFAQGQVTGSPVLVSNKVVWTKNQTQVVTATFNGEGKVTRDSGDASGELPAGAATQNNLFVAFVSKNQDQRSIWLIKK
jgi:hypothetical protein